MESKLTNLESAKQHHSNLHYGATIYLKFEDQGTNYFAYVEGFSKVNLMLKSEEEFAKKNLYLSGLFRIYPAFYNAEYIKSKTMYEQGELAPSRLESSKRVKGSPVQYGQIFQLMHVLSKKFVRFDPKKSSEFEGDNFKLEVSDEYSEETCFRILPCFSFEKGQFSGIFDNEQVVIASTLDQINMVTGEPFIHVSKPYPTQNLVKTGVAKEKREINISTEKRSNWRISIFSDYIDEKDGFLCFGDIIWINYSEDDMSINARRITKTKRSKDTRVTEEKRWLFEFITCKSSEKYKKFVGNTNGLFIIERENMLKGGRVQWDHHFRLRHLTSNCYIAFEDGNNFHNDTISALEGNPQTLNLVERVEDSELFQFEIIYSTIATRNKDTLMKYLEKDSYFRLRSANLNDSPCKWLNIVELQASTMKNIMDDASGEIVLLGLVTDVHKEESVFKLAKGNSSDVILTNFLISSQNTIRRVLPFLLPEEIEKCLTGNLTYYRSLMQKLALLQKTLEDLNLFCYNKLRTYLSFDIPFGQRNAGVQNILREQNFVEMLIEILFTAFPSTSALAKLMMIDEGRKSDEVAIQKRTSRGVPNKDLQRDLLSKKYAVCCSVYDLISSLGVGNKDSEMYIFKYIPFFQIQAGHIHNAVDCIISVIGDNEELLLNLRKAPEQSNDKLSRIFDPKVMKDKGSRMDFLRKMTVHSSGRGGSSSQTNRRATEEVYQQFSNLNEFKSVEDWDIIKFFIEVYLNTDSPLLQLKLMRFFISVSSIDDQGLNVNQETILNTIEEQNSNGIDDLIRIYSENDKIFVKLVKLQRAYTLEELFLRKDQEVVIMDFSTPMGENEDIAIAKAKEAVINQLEFLSAMCNSRNHTWKNIVDSKVTSEALIRSLSLPLDEDLKGLLTKLLMSLYIDQEPLKEVVYPRLCKIAEFKSNIPGSPRRGRGYSPGISLKKATRIGAEDYLPIVDVSNQVIQLMVATMQQTQKSINELPFEVSRFGDEQTEDRINKKYERCYNGYTFQMIRLVKMMIKFGQFLLEEGKDHEGERKLFTIVLKSLFTILEYEKAYPEARGMLIERRLQDQKSHQLKKGFRLIDNLFSKGKQIFGLPEESLRGKRAKKRMQAMDFNGDEMGSRESFLNQSEVIKQLLNSLYSDVTLDVKIKIKLEILDIVDYLLDYKVDLYLENLKKLFLSLLDEGNSRKKSRTNEETVAHYMKFFEKKIPTILRQIFPEIMKTGTPIDMDDVIVIIGNKNFQGLQDPLDLNKLLGFNVLPSLLQLFVLTANQDLETQILKTTMRLFDQRMNILDNARGMLLIFDEVNSRIYQLCRRKLNRLAKLCDESEKWLKVENTDRDILEEAISLFDFLNQVLFSSTSVAVDGEHLSVPVSGLVDKVKIDPIRQDLLRHLKAYSYPISIVRDAIHMLDPDEDNDHEIVDLFRRAFTFLTNFVRDNTANQTILSESLVIFIYNMATNVGQVELINEIFRNNKRLCIDKSGEILDDFFRLIISKGRQPKFLEIFEIVQFDGTEYIYPNQKIILNMLLDPKYKAQMLYINETTSNVAGSRASFSFVPRRGFKDEPFSYHAKLIEVLYATAIGKDGLYLNETRLRALFNLRYIVELLSFPDTFTTPTLIPPRGLVLSHQRENDMVGLSLLKIPLLNYLYFVFFESEKVAEDFLRYGDDFIQFIDRERRRLDNLEEMEESYAEYLFENLVRIVNCYIRTFINNQTETSLHGDEENDPSIVIFNFAQSIKTNIDKFPEGSITADGEQQLKELLIAFDLADEDDTLIWTVKTGMKGHDKRRQSKSYRYNKLPINDMSPDNLTKHLWDVFIETIIKNDSTKVAVQTEQMVLAKGLNAIDHVFGGNDVTKEVISKSEVCLNVITYLQQNFMRKTNKKLNIMLLNLLGNIIECQSDKESKVESQTFLNERNASLMMLSQLSHQDLDEDLRNHLISFGIKLLNGGNLEVQKSISYYFTNFTSSEIFFQQIHEQIHLEIQKLKKTETEVQQQAERDTFLDNFLRMNDPMNNNLRFLQLFAEGHYLPLQNYVRQQTSNYHSYDLIGDILTLLSLYLNIRSSENFRNMIQCFDTLSEFIQGPCYENQFALIQGGFLEISSTLLSLDEVATELYKDIAKKPTILLLSNTSITSRVPLRRWMVARLKYKCSITLLSLLEARKDNDIAIRMLKSLQIEVIKRNISDIYRVFVEDYNQNYSTHVFYHFMKDPDGKVYTDDYCSFIIETGFNLFILLSYFLEARTKGNDDDDEDLDDLPGFGEDDNILKNNIVGKLGSFGLIIVRTGFKSLASLTSSLWKRTKKLRDQMFKGDVVAQIDDDHNILLRKLNEGRNEIYSMAHEFFSQNTAHIEVLLEDKRLEKAYFSIPPFCKALTKETKTDFNRQANRISAKAKVTSLLKESNLLITIIRHEYRLNILYNKIAVIGTLVKNIQLVRDLAFILAITINALILFIYVKDDQGKTSTDNESLERVVYDLGYTLIVLSLMIAGYFLAKTAPLLIQKAWAGVQTSKLNILALVNRTLTTVYYFLSDFFVLYYIIYGLAAVLALTVNPFFFGFHLFDILVLYPTLLNVIRSVWIPKKSLFLTLFLVLILDYVFSLLGYYWLDEDYHGWCPNTFVCWLTSIDKSFKADGGLGGLLGSDNNFLPYDGVSYIRFVFDNVYMLLIMIILLNIILGIIIDTFRTLREEEKKFLYDVRNICFICGHDRETLDKASVSKNGFIHHIKEDHYMWNYLFFIAYLQTKEFTEYTGIESYVAKRIAKEDVNWFPSHRAIALKDMKIDNDNQKKIDQLLFIQGEQTKLLQHSKSVLENVNKVEQKLNDRKKHQVSSKTIKE